MAESTIGAGAPWRVRPLVSLTWHEWRDEGSVAFDETSGQIIELDTLAGAVMACLEAGPGTVAAIADALAADLGLASDDEFRHAVDQIVEQFHHLGWVDQIIAG
jgi:PqqD family protein of HPr-rel-A system